MAGVSGVGYSGLRGAVPRFHRRRGTARTDALTLSEPRRWRNAVVSGARRRHRLWTDALAANTAPPACGH